jgi:hypothetical protein
MPLTGCTVAACWTAAWAPSLLVRAPVTAQTAVSTGLQAARVKTRSSSVPCQPAFCLSFTLIH